MVQIKSVAVLRCGIVLAVLYAFFGLIEALFVVPIVMMAPAGAPNSIPDTVKPFVGIGAFFFLPILFAIAGFIGGVIAAQLYNLVARWTGGLEVRLEQVTTV